MAAKAIATSTVAQAIASQISGLQRTLESDPPIPRPHEADGLVADARSCGGSPSSPSAPPTAWGRVTPNCDAAAFGVFTGSRP